MTERKSFNMDEVRQIEVIICTKKRRGVSPDPIRIITEVFTLDGKLIAEYDPQTDVQ